MTALFAEAPALPLHAAGKFVAGAYVVFVAVLLIYVWIMARRLHATQRELAELKALVDERERAAVERDGTEVPSQTEPERVP